MGRWTGAPHRNFWGTLPIRTDPSWSEKPPPRARACTSSASSILTPSQSTGSLSATPTRTTTSRARDRGSGQVWFIPHNKFSSLTELIKFCSDNLAPGVKTKLTNICLIPNPHADKTFEYWNEMQDSLRVPLTEITWKEPKEILGTGQFGEVFSATFRGNLKVAVKQLKVKEATPGEAEKALEEFFTEISVIRGLNHPNLVQLFAYVTSAKDGNFMIQEFMANGDLKS